jgi:hypothetical protein
MIVTYPIQTPAMSDAIEMAKRMATSQGYKTPVLLEIRPTGTGSWSVKLQVTR